jgi:magnesium chelatase family protein
LGIDRLGFVTEPSRTWHELLRTVDRVLARAITHTLVGLDARTVEVEAHLQRGIPAFAIVGLPDKACQEAKERVRSGIGSAELEFPGRRITVNLAPAGLRKEGSGFDLPIALAILAASRQVPPDLLAEHAAVGELALDGRLRPTPGILLAAEAALRAGLTKLLCAAESAPEAALAGIEPIPVRHLAEAGQYLRGRFRPGPVAPAEARPGLPGPDLADVRGQERARRALELAAAGRHNLLLAGPPGTGKTMLGRRLPGILPPLTREQALEATRIHSVAGLLPPDRPLVDRPPFRAPHHTASTIAIVGGGAGPRPGEASLAHHGVLLLDEIAEFPRASLEALRQPLEDGTIAIARVYGRALFPARFVLVGTMNLCPCGARGDPGAECSCSPQRLAAYRERLSRALLDRFDLVVHTPRARSRELSAGPGESSDAVRNRVVSGADRLRGSPPRLGPPAAELLGRAVDSLHLSARGRARVARVATTIAALAGADEVATGHVSEALSYRAPAELAAAAA